MNDLIQITQFPGGKKFRNALQRLAKKYDFAYNDYRRNRLKITLDFATLTQLQVQQERKNSEGI